MTITKRVLITRPRSVSRKDFSKTANSDQTKKVGGLNPLPPSFGGEGGFIRHAENKNENESKPVSKVDDLLNQAKLLTAKQRQELLDQLSLVNKISRSADQDRDLEMWTQAVYETLVSVPTASEGSGYGKMLVKQVLSPSQAWRPIQDFMQQSQLCELKVVERGGVYYLLADLLVKYASKVSDRSGAPLGPKLVGSCTTNIAGVFDQAFPGYLRAGLAKIAARQYFAGRA
jgi:hypothetical protein